MRVKIETNLPVDFLREGDKFIACSPALDISTCGSSFEQAKERFEELVDIFFEELVRKGTLEDVLLDCGWRKIKKGWVPPTYITHTQETVKIPAVV